MTTIQTNQAPCNPCVTVPMHSTGEEHELLDPRAFEQAKSMSSDEIEQFQLRHGLPRTGEANMETMKAIAAELDECESGQEASEIDKDALYRNNPTTMRGQRALNAYFGDRCPLQVDGIRGPNTTARIEEFQCQNGLEVTGKLDAPTRKALFGAETNRCEGNGEAEPVRQEVQVNVRRVPQEEFLRQHGNLNAPPPIPVESHWTDMFDTSENGVLQHITNFGAGVGDAASFGATNLLRHYVGGNESVGKDTGMYIGGAVVGEGAKAVLIQNPGATGAAAKQMLSRFIP